MTSWSVSPSLPAGLSLDSSTGAISGTPSAVTSSATYTVTASNTGGSDTATLTFVVNDVAPSSIAYSPSSFTLTKGTAMTTVTPTSSGGTVTSWSVSPSLPAGLSIDSSTGAISGTPSAVTSSATYTVTASNTGGSDTTDLDVRRERCRAFVSDIQSKFIHPHQGHGHDDGNTNQQRWNGDFVVCFSLPPRRAFA